MLAYVGPVLSHLGGYVGHTLRICWPILGLCLPMLALWWSHLGGYAGIRWGYVAYLGPMLEIC